MNTNTCIKTEPTIMADDEFEVNTYDINMNILQILYFVKYLIF